MRLWSERPDNGGGGNSYGRGSLLDAKTVAVALITVTVTILLAAAAGAPRLFSSVDSDDVKRIVQEQSPYLTDRARILKDIERHEQSIAALIELTNANEVRSERNIERLDQLRADLAELALLLQATIAKGG